jgi:DNA polymerase-4
MSNESIILETAKALLYQSKMENSVRLLGISISNLNTKDKKGLTKEKAINAQLVFKF